MTAERPKRRPVTAQVQFTEHHLYQLLHGNDFFDQAYGRDVENDPERLAWMRDDWESRRDELLRAWIIQHPGQRPWAWWLFDANDRRETADGTVHPFDRPERRELAERWHAKHPDQSHLVKMFQLYYGCPALIVGEGLVRYETEAAYLARLGLLLPGEAELIDGVTIASQ
jgi:hypothetical protein